MKIRIIKVDSQILSIVIDQVDQSDEYVSKLEVLEYPGEGYVDNEGRSCSYFKQKELPVVIFSKLDELNLVSD